MHHSELHRRIERINAPYRKRDDHSCCYILYVARDARKLLLMTHSKFVGLTVGTAISLITGGTVLGLGISTKATALIVVGAAFFVIGLYAHDHCTPAHNIIHRLCLVGSVMQFMGMYRRGIATNEHIQREIDAQNAEFERNHNGLHFMYTRGAGKVPHILWLEVGVSGACCTALYIYVIVMQANLSSIR